MSFRNLSLCLLLMFLLNPGYSQMVYNDSIMDGGNFEKSAFRLWYAENSIEFRGIIVLVPGSNGDGRDMVNDTSWQNLAMKHDFALLGCCFKDKPHENMAIEEYADAGKGSGQALINSIKNLALETKHPELKSIPMALWGSSAGGEFNYEFVCSYPKRVLAFIVNKGGVYYTSLASPAVWDVPGIFFTGSEDSPYRNNIVKGIFSINRRFGAKWIFIEEKGVSHEFKQSAEFARFYFDQIIPMRISDDSSALSFSLKKLSSPGYIGIESIMEIQPDSVRIPDEISSWFPNRIIAEKWLELMGADQP